MGAASGRRRVVGLACAISIALSSSAAAFAQPAPLPAQPAPLPAPPPNPSAQDLQKAKAVFEAGGRAFEQGDFPAAIQAFEQAYALSGRASVLFSLAQAHRKRFVDTGAALHRETALQLYRAYLAEVKTGGRRADAIKGIEALGAVASAPPGTAPVIAPLVKKTQLAIDSATPGAMISVDGGPPAPPQVMAEVSEGRHTIRVTAPGHVTKEFTTQAVAGQITPETYELEEEPAKVQIAMPSGATVYVDGRDMGESSQVTLPSGNHFIAVAKTGHHSEARGLEVTPGDRERLSFDLRTTTQRDVAIGFLISGAATIVGGGVVLGVAFVRQAEAIEIDDRRQEGTITSDERARYEQLSIERDQLRATGVVIGGVGGIAFLIGGALFFLDNPAPQPPPADGFGGGKKKSDDRPAAPGEMEELSFVPWINPIAGNGLEAGGAWTVKF